MLNVIILNVVAPFWGSKGIQALLLEGLAWIHIIIFVYFQSCLKRQKINTKAQYYKTFYGRNLGMPIIR